MFWLITVILFFGGIISFLFNLEPFRGFAPLAIMLGVALAFVRMLTKGGGWRIHT